MLQSIQRTTSLLLRTLSRQSLFYIIDYFRDVLSCHVDKDAAKLWEPVFTNIHDDEKTSELRLSQIVNKRIETIFLEQLQEMAQYVNDDHASTDSKCIILLRLF